MQYNLSKLKTDPAIVADIIKNVEESWGAPNEIKGKVAVVTGASQGIGEACAKKMLGAGASVVVVGRDLEKLKAAYSGFGDAAIPMAADLGTEQDRHELVERILNSTSQIDIFVANAGAYIGGQSVDNDPKEIERVWNLNTLGVITPVRHVLPHMIGRNTGDIVVIGSIAGDGYLPYHEPYYGPSKAAPERHIKLLRRELCNTGVRAGTISPGPTATPLIAGWDPDRLAEALKENGLMPASQVADALEFMVTRPRNTQVPNMTITPLTFDLL